MRVRAAVAAGADVVITTGGTGHLADRRHPGGDRAAARLRGPGPGRRDPRRGRAAVPTAVLSRGLSGVVGRTLVVNLPGSTGGVRDGLARARRRPRPRRRPARAAATTDRAAAGDGGRDAVAAGSATSRSTSPSTRAGRRPGRRRVVTFARRGARPRRRPGGPRAGVPAPTRRAGGRRPGRRRVAARPRGAGARGEPPGRRAGRRRRRAGLRRRRRAPAGGLRDLRATSSTRSSTRCRCGSTRCSPTAPTSGSTRPERPTTALSSGPAPAAVPLRREPRARRARQAGLRHVQRPPTLSTCGLARRRGWRRTAPSTDVPRASAILPRVSPRLTV